MVVKGWTLTGLDLTPSLTPLGCLEFDLIKPSWSSRYDTPTMIHPLDRFSPHPLYITSHPTLIINSHFLPPLPILITATVLPMSTHEMYWTFSLLMTSTPPVTGLPTVWKHKIMITTTMITRKSILVLSATTTTLWKNFNNVCVNNVCNYGSL